MEAENTWVSVQTPIKLAKAFGIEPYELLKPEKEGKNHKDQQEIARTKEIMDKFSKNLAAVLKIP